LLLAYAGWFKEDEDGSKVPLPFVKRLRKAEEAQYGLLALQDLASAAAALTPPQLKRLGEECPAMGYVAIWRDAFRIYAASPELAERLGSKEGLSLRDIPPALLASPGPVLSRILSDENAAALRLTASDSLQRKPPTRQIAVEVLSSQGGPLVKAEFTLRGSEAK
jgi:hypothetical protein